MLEFEENLRNSDLVEEDEVVEQEPSSARIVLPILASITLLGFGFTGYLYYQKQQLQKKNLLNEDQITDDEDP